MSIGENIKSRREAQGLSQIEMAEKLGVTQSMLCQIERGTKIPSLPLGCEIAKTLGCDIKEIID